VSVRVERLEPGDAEELYAAIARSRALHEDWVTPPLDHAFGEHGLHRVKASVQPGNVKSARLLLGLGFRLEGHSPRYLKVAGEWRDQDHYAMTAEEWPGRR
jgi:[ribosomal protein S5]-alanine N-acetyltransferase